MSTAQDAGTSSARGGRESTALGDGGEAVAAGAGTAGECPPARIRETHSAVVVLLGDRAYKVKKPVNLGFLDFRRRESREAACHREVELNRRMAPDVYLGVLDVLDRRGRPCEHVVVMRRMPDDRRLSVLVRGGDDVRGGLRRLARALADFHTRARTGPDVSVSGSAEALQGRWTANLATLRELRPEALSSTALDAVDSLARRYIDGRATLLTARIAAGYVRDCHGDLLADDIFLLEDGPRVLDCLDFDDTLRWMDVLDDVACLAADLERLGAADAAAELLDDYHRFSAVPQPASLRHHYIAYRAVMRAKVAAIRAGTSCGTDADEAARECIELCHLGLAHLDHGRIRLVLVGGPPGSGKTTVAGRLAEATAAVPLSSDRIRKEIHGFPPTHHEPAPYETGIYTAQASRRAYAEVAARAARLLVLGESVVVDASFTRAQDRELLRLVAADTSSDVVELCCSATPEVLRERLLLREEHPAETSDATLRTGVLLAAAADPWPEALVVPTGGPQSAAADLAIQAVQAAQSH